MLNEAKNDYLLNCFLYIHQNPIEAGIVDKLEDWEFSSYLDYIRKRNGTLADVKQGLELMNIDVADMKFVMNSTIRDLGDENYL